MAEGGDQAIRARQFQDAPALGLGQRLQLRRVLGARRFRLLSFGDVQSNPDGSDDRFIGVTERLDVSLIGSTHPLYLITDGLSLERARMYGMDVEIGIAGLVVFEQYPIDQLP